MLPFPWFYQQAANSILLAVGSLSGSATFSCSETVSKCAPGHCSSAWAAATEIVIPLLEESFKSPKSKSGNQKDAFPSPTLSAICWLPYFYFCIWLLLQNLGLQLEMTWLLNLGPFKVYRFWSLHFMVSILAY